MRCWLVFIGLAEPPCEGRTDLAHVGFPEHYLLKAPTGPRLSKDEANDPRLLRGCCRAHHHQLDKGSISLTRAHIPYSVEDYALEYGLTVYLDKHYGPRLDTPEIM